MEELWKTIDDGKDSVYQRAQLLEWIQRWEAAQNFHEWPAQRFQPPMIPPVFMPPNPTTAAPSPVPQSESSYGSAELFRPSMIIAVGTLDMTSDGNLMIANRLGILDAWRTIDIALQNAIKADKHL